MATGKLRTNKRSSGGSYTTTVTTLVFVCICVLGLWILTSNSYVNPNKSSTRVSQLRSRKIPVDSPTFEDNTGDLPEDATRPDTNQTNDTDTTQQVSEVDKELKNKTQETANDQTEVDEEPKHRTEETKQQDKDDQTQLSDSEVEKHPHASEVEEEPKDKTEKEQQTEKSEIDEEPKNKTEEIQKSDQNQRVEEMPAVKNTSADEDHQRRRNDHQQTDKNEDIIEEEQENRMEKHQEQSQTEETIDDQMRHESDEEKQIEHRPGNETKEETKREYTAIVPYKDSNASVTVMIAGEGSSGIPKESNESKKGWKTQAGESSNQKDGGGQGISNANAGGEVTDKKWVLCNVTSGTDYIPCLDNQKAIEELGSKSHFEQQERHCPVDGPMCLVPMPEGYKTPIPWPHSRDKIWIHNVPHKLSTDVKGDQVKVTGEFLTFPGGGTQFIHGALHYIDMLQQVVPEIGWGKHTRVVLDVGCGVGSFGGYLFDRNVLPMSFAPNYEHEAQVQLALERGIPAISAVMGTRRLPFPSKVFDLIHCAHCNVPWHREGGILLLEVNRLLRPGGYFVWSAAPVVQKHGEDVQEWKEMSALTEAMCWELITVKTHELDSVGIAIYRKPESNTCYNARRKQLPPICQPNDDPNAAWYIPLQACMHNNPIGDTERGSRWPEEWPARVQTPPYWLNESQMGIYGKPDPIDFKVDYEHWKRVVSQSYMSGLGFNWTNVRNVMDMRAVYGGFAAALKDLQLWVLNVVDTNSPDTLPIIFERGLFGIYHDWCESFSSYPRTYDLLHADHLFSMLKKRCKIEPVMVEVDRIVRPGGKLIVRDESSMIGEVENLLKSLNWDVHLTFSKNQEGILSAQKSNWRPDAYAASS